MSTSSRLRPSIAKLEVRYRSGESSLLSGRASNSSGLARVWHRVKALTLTSGGNGLTSRNPAERRLPIDSRATQRGRFGLIRSLCQARRYSRRPVAATGSDYCHTHVAFLNIMASKQHQADTPWWWRTSAVRRCAGAVSLWCAQLAEGSPLRCRGISPPVHCATNVPVPCIRVAPTGAVVQLASIRQRSRCTRKSCRPGPLGDAASTLV